MVTGSIAGADHASLHRCRAGALVAGGACIALWLAVHPYGALVGATPPQTLMWSVAHHLHLAGALLVLVGLPAVARGLPLAVATAGMGLFLATGVVTADVMPAVAAAAPAVMGADGPFYSGTYFGVLVAQRLLAGVGLAWVAFAAARGNVVPKAAAWTTLAGGVLVALPPQPLGPFPWAAMLAGGVAWGTGVAWLGVGAWRAAGEAGHSNG